MIKELDERLIYLRQKRERETNERIKKIMEEYEDLKNSLIEQLYDEKRSVQEGMTAWENEERSNIYKYFKMHYENAKRYEEYGNRMRKYDEETQQQKAREQIQKLYYEMQTQKNVIKYQEQQARDDLNEMNNEIKSRHISEWEKKKLQFFNNKYMEILDDLERDGVNLMDEEENAREAIESRYTIGNYDVAMYMQPEYWLTDTVEKNILNPPKRMTATVGLPVERVELRQPALTSAPIKLPTANLGRQPANYALPPGRLQTPDIPIGIKPIKNIHNVLPANEKAE